MRAYIFDGGETTNDIVQYTHNAQPAAVLYSCACTGNSNTTSFPVRRR